MKIAVRTYKGQKMVWDLPPDETYNSSSTGLENIRNLIIHETFRETGHHPVSIVIEIV